MGVGVKGWWGSGGSRGGGGLGVIGVGESRHDGSLGGPTFKRRCCQDVGCFILNYVYFHKEASGGFDTLKCILGGGQMQGW